MILGLRDRGLIVSFISTGLIFRQVDPFTLWNLIGNSAYFTCFATIYDRERRRSIARESVCEREKERESEDIVRVWVRERKGERERHSERAREREKEQEMGSLKKGNDIGENVKNE